MTEKFMGVEFVRFKFSAMDGRTVVTFTEKGMAAHDNFEVRATPEGIKFKGLLEKVISNTEELEEFARLVAEAWKEHRKLAPKITLNLAGHE